MYERCVESTISLWFSCLFEENTVRAVSRRSQQVVWETRCASVFVRSIAYSRRHQRVLVAHEGYRNQGNGVMVLHPLDGATLQTIELPGVYTPRDLQVSGEHTVYWHNDKKWTKYQVSFLKVWSTPSAPTSTQGRTTLTSTTQSAPASQPPREPSSSSSAHHPSVLPSTVESPPSYDDIQTQSRSPSRSPRRSSRPEAAQSEPVGVGITDDNPDQQ